MTDEEFKEKVVELLSAMSGDLQSIEGDVGTIWMEISGLGSRLSAIEGHLKIIKRDIG